MNIAVDGHAGSGKSAIAKEIAKALKFQVFDTGAMYRALACEWDARGLGKMTKGKVEKFIKTITISVKFVEGIQHTYVNGVDYTPVLRLEKISKLSSMISPFPCVRDMVKEIQRDFAKHNNCVMEGRDIGSVVLPNAEYKFFITAPVEIRARRRYEQEIKNQPDIDFNNVLEDLKKRDYADEHREIAPLIIVEDSIVVNNTGKSLKEVIDECLRYIKK